MIGTHHKSDNLLESLNLGVLTFVAGAMMAGLDSIGGGEFRAGRDACCGVNYQRRVFERNAHDVDEPY